MQDDHFIVFDGRTLDALDPQTGALRWRTPIAGCALYNRVAIAEGVVIVVGLDDVYCCDYSMGTILWRASIPHGGKAPGVLVKNGRVYVLTQEGVLCFDGRGTLLFHHRSEHYHGGSMGFPDAICWSPPL
jgi:outer membrane protein assembly factor BamB